MTSSQMLDSWQIIELTLFLQILPAVNNHTKFRIIEIRRNHDEQKLRSKRH